MPATRFVLSVFTCLVLVEPLRAELPLAGPNWKMDDVDTFVYDPTSGNLSVDHPNDPDRGLNIPLVGGWDIVVSEPTFGSNRPDWLVWRCLDQYISTRTRINCVNLDALFGQDRGFGDIDFGRIVSSMISGSELLSHRLDVESWFLTEADDGDIALSQLLSWI